MEETTSLCSGSPESKTTIYTPVNSSYNDFTQVVGQSPYTGYTPAYDDDFDKPHHLRKISGLIPQGEKIRTEINGDYLSYEGFSTMWNSPTCVPQNIDDWTATSTRFLKLGNIDPSIPNHLLFTYLRVPLPVFVSLFSILLFTIYFYRKLAKSKSTMLSDFYLTACVSLLFLI
jgi:hypothetical protein